MMISATEPTLASSLQLISLPVDRTSLVYRSRINGVWKRHVLVTSAIALIVLPLAYASILNGATTVGLRPEQQFHVTSVVLANILVFIIGGNVRGQLQRKIGVTLCCAILIHVLVILLIVLARLYYSRTVLFGAMCVSATCGLGQVYFIHVKQRRKVAAVAVGLSDEMISWLGRGVQFVQDPHADLRQYDVILVNFQLELKGEWARAVFRASLAGSEISNVVEYLERAQGRVSPEHFSIDHLGASGMLTQYARVKRATDVLVVVLLSPVVLLVTCAAMLAIQITMGTPTLFCNIE